MIHIFNSLCFSEKWLLLSFTATLARRRERAGADFVHPMASGTGISH
jgi:hypothetical protein